MCRLCDSRGLECVLDLGKTPVGDAYERTPVAAAALPLYPLTLDRCMRCGHLQLGEVLSPEELYVRNYLYLSTISLNLDTHFEAYADAILRLDGVSAGDLIVDAGSNAGLLLASLQNRAMRVFGIEPSPQVAETAVKNGIPTECAFFTPQTASSLAASQGRPAVITANNVFANVDDLGEFMAAVDVLLSDRGWFIMETGYGLDLVYNTVIDNIYHEHLNYFLCSPLQDFFMRHGFVIVAGERVPTKGGSLRVYCRRAGQGRPDWSISGLIQIERELGLLDVGLGVYKRFAGLLEEQKNAALRETERVAAKGRVAGFGAAVGCTTMLYWLGVGGYIDFLVDGNPIKHGLYSPGFAIPVLIPDELENSMPDVVINLPWRYYGTIFTKYSAYLDKGGFVLQPLPWVEMRSKSGV